MNTTLAVYDIKTVMIRTIFRFFRNSFNLYIILYLIIYTFSEQSVVYASISPRIAFGFLAFNLVVDVVTNLFLLNKTRKLDGFWDKKSIAKLTKKGGRKVFKDVNISQLMIGDLVLVKANSTCPADVLIIDTAEQRLSEKIAYVNERRLNGRRGINVKTAIKNLNPLNNLKERNPQASLKKLTQTLKGQIEYDSPSPDIENFKGNFKLSNDPKVLKITKNNFLFCGSRLYTNWVIGFILYNGKNTKILQRNSKMVKTSLGGKMSTLDRFINYFGILCIGYCLAEILLLYLSLSTIKTTKYVLVRKINELKGTETSFGFFTIRIFQIFLALALKAPITISPILSVVNLFYIFKLEQTDLNDESDGDGIMALIDAKSKSVIAKNTNRTSSKESDRNSRKDQISSARKGKDGIDWTKKSDLSPARTMGFKPMGGSSLNRIPSLRRGASMKSLDNIKPLFKKNEQSVRVINTAILSDLGNIDHVFFDKTDTLTLSTVEITMASTLDKLFKIDMRSLSKTYSMVKKDPSKYQRVEDMEEVMRQKEDENYSEKSQEFFKEVKGEYDPGIFDEEMELNDDVFKDIREPQYLTMSCSRKEKIDKKRITRIKSLQNSEVSFNRSTSRNVSPRTSKGRIFSKRRSGILSNLQKSGTYVDVSMASILAGLSKKEKIFKQKLESMSFGKISSKRKSFQMKAKLPLLETITENETKNRDLSFSRGSSDYSFDEPEEAEIKIKVNPNKEFEQEDLLCDYYFKSEKLIELMECLILCHEATTTPSGKIKSFRGEEKAMLDICNKLGMSFEIQNDDSSHDFYKTFKVKLNRKLSQRFNIAGINSWGERNRMSVVLNDPQKGRDSFILYVRGYAQGMKKVLKMTPKEKNNYKRLMVKFKKEGLKTLVFAKKVLTLTEVKTYIKAFKLIRKSRKDQIENLENLAIDLETNLEFVGALAYKSNVRNGANELIQTFKDSDISMSLLTGDHLENAMNVASSLKLVNIDFRDSSEFYSLRFSNVKDAVLTIRRIFQYIYDKMRELSVENLEKQDNLNEEDKKKSNLINKSPNVPRKMVRLKTDVFMDEVEERSNKTGRKKLKKPILVSGKAIEIILSDEKLISHFKFLLVFARNIIGYSLSPYHKSVIVRFFKETKRISVLAVGDGFNDMAMLEASDVGIQIYHKDVPLIFGDIISPDLKMVSKIMFYNGKLILANSLQAILLSFYSYLTLNALEFYYMIDSLFTGSLFSGVHMVLFSFLQIVLLIYMGINTDPYQKPVLYRFPIIYKEKNFLLKNFFKTSGAVFMISFAESSYIYMSMRYFMVTRARKEGYSRADNGIAIYFLLSILILSVGRVYLSMYKKATSLLMLGFFCVFSILMVLLTAGATIDSIINPFPIVRVMTSTNLAIALVHSILIPFFFEYFFITIFKNFAIYPIFKQIMDKYRQKDYLFFIKNSKQKISKLLFHGIKFRLIDSAKICYKERAVNLDMDVKKILSLDSNTLSLGMNPYTCKISDLNDKKRFELYINSKQSSLVAMVISITMVLSFVEWVVLNIFNPIDDINHYFDTITPYIFMILMLPLYASTEAKYQKMTKNFLIASLILVPFFLFIISLNTIIPVDYGLFIFIRFTTGPIITDFIYSAFTITMILFFTMLS